MTEQEIDKMYGTDATVLTFKPVCSVCGNVFEDIEATTRNNETSALSLPDRNRTGSLFPQIIFTPYYCSKCNRRVTTLECKNKYLEFFK